ncbi:hypothetical protein BKA69DRAFT_1126902 [Paraphysoderma sedebokerense]|nr:hypothetical protein BKA69DRAFT_1126902 [Paraphysoderma sedebokerense]
MLSVKNLAILIVALTTVELAAAQGKSAKNCSADQKVCITLTDDGSNLQFKVEGPPDVKNLWLGVGFGESMLNSEVFVTWTGLNGILEGNIGNSRTAPQLEKDDDIKVTGAPAFNEQTKRFTANYVVPKKHDGLNVDVSKPISLIWAYNDKVPVPTSNAITKHTNQGKFKIDLNNPSASQNSAESVANGGAILTGVVATLTGLAALM